MVLPPGLLTDRPCEEQFRETLANYDGVERFDAALVTALSRMSSWSSGPTVWPRAGPLSSQTSRWSAKSRTDLPGAIYYKYNPRAVPSWWLPHSGGYLGESGTNWVSSSESG